MQQEAMDLSCKAFVDKLASKASTPGGGSAAAFVGAIGTALGNMVGSLTVGNPKYADVQDDIIELKTRADALQQRFIELVAADAAAFEPLSKAYGLPKETEEQKAYKAKVMERCLHDACEVPLQIMRACGQAIELHEQFAAKGSAIAISDVGCGVICCKGAMQAASLNIFINTHSMTQRDFAAACNDEAHALMEVYLPKADSIFADVKKRFL